MLQKKTEQLLSQATPQQLEEIKWLLEHPEYEERPVDVETFVNHPQYLGLNFTVKGNKGYGCRPRILSRLKEIFDPVKDYEEFVLACGIGWGKDFTSSIVLSYQLYRLACLKDPQTFFGLSRGSAIHLMLMSINETHARDVLFGEVRARIDNSDWFKRNFKYNLKINSELQFLTKNIRLIPGNSRETTFIGYNIFCAIIDEGDDYLVTETRDDATEGYNAIKDRIVSRFRDKGLLGIIGSPKRVDGFIMQSYRNEEGTPNRYRLLVPTWDSLLNTSLLCGETFEMKGMVIPIEYQPRFKADPDRALRDLGARPFLAKQPFITLTERIDEMFVKRDLLFTKKEDDRVGAFSKFVSGIKGDENTEYFCHIDLAVNRKRGDRLGFAIGHIGGWKEIENEEKPIVDFDIVMVITAPSGGEIILSDVKQMIFFLRDRGFNFRKLTMDSWNSVGMLQSFKSSDIPGEILSVDKTVEPYNVLKDAIYEKRIICHEYKLLKDELGRLELINGEKVEHPKDFSKDCSDAVCGVVYSIHKSNSSRVISFSPSFGRKREFKYQI